MSGECCHLADYGSRVDKPFAHAGYMNRLSELRDRLRLGLSEHPPEDQTPVAELAEDIRALMAGRALDPAPPCDGRWENVARAG